MGVSPQDLLSDETIVRTDGAIDAARLAASGPPPHTCCPMAPAGCKNGGQNLDINQSALVAGLIEQLPDPAQLPDVSGDLSHACENGLDIVPEPVRAPGLLVT